MAAAAAAADKVLCSKACALQHADKTNTDGMLYVYQTLARFMPKGGGNAQHKLEILMADIKGQKKAKANPLLMLDTASNGRVILKFNSPEERDEASLTITNAGKPAAAAAGGGGGAAAAQQPATAAAGGNSQNGAQQLPAHERQKLLQENSKLAEQHKSLVLDSKALTEDEFWSSAAVLKVAGIAGKPTTSQRASKKGLANKLVDLARQHEAAGDARLAQVNMTAEDERQLLAEKPALKQIYDAQVGAIMTREEFWQRYFRYYMAKRIKRGGAMRRFKQLQQNLMADSAAAVADMTGGDPQQEETADYELSALFSVLDGNSSLDDSARKALKRRLNPVVDLAAAAQDSMTADGYGLAHNSVRSDAEQVQGYSALSQQLAQDYNTHAAAVMGQAPPAGATVAAAAATAGSSSRGATAAGAAAAASGQAGAEVMQDMAEEERKRFKKQAGSGLDDLSAPLHQEFEELHVTNPRLYFSNIQQQQQQHPSQQQQQQRQGLAVKLEVGSQQQQQQQQQAQPQDVLLLLRGVDPNDLTDRPIEPQVANKVLHELCGGDVADAARWGGPKSLPEEGINFMQRQTMVVDELLRHFWSQIPVNTPEKEAKMKRIQHSLDETYKLLNKTLDECSGPHKAALGRLIKPLRDQLDVASDAYKAVVKALAAKQQQRGRPRPQQ